MSALISADFLKLRRRSLWWAALGIPFGVCLLVVVLEATGVVTSHGGSRFLGDLETPANAAVTLMSVLIGARLGSEEHASGTLRYQLLTGISRTRLFASKLGVMGVACLAIVAVTTVAGLLGTVVVPGDDPFRLHDVIVFVWNQLLNSVIFGVIALGVGGLLRSTGSAIAIALLLNFVGVNIVLALTAIDPWFRHLALGVGIDRLSTRSLSGGDTVTLGSAVIVTLAWPLVFAWLGLARLRRTEA